MPASYSAPGDQVEELRNKGNSERPATKVVQDAPCDEMTTKQRAATARTNSPRVNFITDTISELKKVSWLSRREVIYLSSLVLLVTVVVGIFLALVDFGFTRLVNGVFLGG